MLTGGNVADCTAGAKLLSKMPACDILHGDKGYDSDVIRRQVENAGVMPNIPPKANRKWKNCFSPFSLSRAAEMSPSSEQVLPWVEGFRDRGENGLRFTSRSWGREDFLAIVCRARRTVSDLGYQLARDRVQRILAG